MYFNNDLFESEFYGNFFEYAYLVLLYVTFWYFYYLVKCACGERLASRLWNSFLFLTQSSCLGFPWAFCGNQLFEFYRNSTDWLQHDTGSGWGESPNTLLTVLYFFFFCLLVVYIYIAPLRVFFEYVSCKLFWWYLLILMTCV